MLFNSFAFVVFFPTVVAAYFALPHRHRWILLLAASYYFYGSWRIEYLGLLMLTTLTDYVLALRMGERATGRERRPFLIASVALNLGVLGIFKYANFAASGLATILHLPNSFAHLDLLLPVGISFYTFQAISYTVDVYRGAKEPERHLGIFALYVSFFPQLVAGPIERSAHLLPQFRREHRAQYDRVASGLRRIAWGFFKKLVIADQAGYIVDAVYASPESFPGQTVILATYLFAFQIYCDFSGYCDIAIGAARVLGFDLMDNFRRPFAAASVREFWRRWHISLCAWFRDYLYIPLGGNRVSKLRMYGILMLVFTLSGLWHGAGLNFILWGALHGFYLVMSIVTSPARDAAWRRVGAWLRQILAIDPGPIRHALGVVLTFHLFVFSLLIFRAGSLTHCLALLQRALQASGLGLGLDGVITSTQFGILLGAIAVMETVQWLQAKQVLGVWWPTLPGALRWSAYYVGVIGILVFGKLGAREFYYFQF